MVVSSPNCLDSHGFVLEISDIWPSMFTMPRTTSFRYWLKSISLSLSSMWNRTMASISSSEVGCDG